MKILSKICTKDEMLQDINSHFYLKYTNR